MLSVLSEIDPPISQLYVTNDLKNLYRERLTAVKCFVLSHFNKWRRQSLENCHTCTNAFKFLNQPMSDNRDVHAITGRKTGEIPNVIQWPLHCWSTYEIPRTEKKIDKKREKRTAHFGDYLQQKVDTFLKASPPLLKLNCILTSRRELALFIKLAIPLGVPNSIIRLTI